MALMNEAEKQILRNQVAIMKALSVMSDVMQKYPHANRISHHISVTNELLQQESVRAATTR